MVPTTAPTAVAPIDEVPKPSSRRIFLVYLTLVTVLARRSAAGDVRPATDEVEPPKLLADGGLVLPGGREVVLAGIYVPPSTEQQANERIMGLLDRPWQFDQLAIDRYRRGMGLVQLQDGGSLQSILVEEGLAYVDPVGFPHDKMGALLDFESQARDAGRGLWSDPQTNEQDANRLRLDEPRYAVVRGEVQRVDERSPYLYLDFGDDWRRDFTIRVDLRDVRRLRREKLDLRALEGREVRVRGWLFWSYGPMLELVQREQIEVIE